MHDTKHNYGELLSKKKGLYKLIGFTDYVIIWEREVTGTDRPLFNPLWPNDALWSHESGSTLAQVMDWCLMASSCYMIQYRLIINKILQHSPEGRAAYRYRFFDIDTNTDTTFRYRYQFDPYRDIHVTILSRVRLFYAEKWRTAIKSTTHNLLQLHVQ